MTNRIRKCRRDRRGATLIEFALVASVFFLVVFGVIEFSRAVMVENLLYAAAREGARTGILTGATTSQVDNAVTNVLTNGGIGGTPTITVTPNPPSNATFGQAVSVAVSIPYSSVSWVPSSWFFASNASMSATCVLLCETSQ